MVAGFAIGLISPMYVFPLTGGLCDAWDICWTAAAAAATSFRLPLMVHEQHPNAATQMTTMATPNAVAMMFPVGVWSKLPLRQ